MLSKWQSDDKGDQENFNTQLIKKTLSIIFYRFGSIRVDIPHVLHASLAKCGEFENFCVLKRGRYYVIDTKKKSAENIPYTYMERGRSCGCRVSAAEIAIVLPSDSWFYRLARLPERTKTRRNRIYWIITGKFMSGRVENFGHVTLSGVDSASRAKCKTG